jgi:hypothetical protein
LTAPSALIIEALALGRAIVRYSGVLIAKLNGMEAGGQKMLRAPAHVYSTLDQTEPSGAKSLWIGAQIRLREAKMPHSRP